MHSGLDLTEKMSYTATTDFLELLRQTPGGVRALRMPGMDYVVAALARAELFSVQIGPTAPVTNQSTTVWFKPAPAGSWVQEGAVFLYNVGTGEYEPASPVLWSSLLLASALPASQVQDITDPGPANILVGAGIVRVNQIVSAPITLIVPPSAAKIGSVLVSDWKGDAGANAITLNLSGADKFPGSLTTWTISNDTGSVFLRPVPGGYAL